MKLYKFKHELIPYCAKGLAPRNYLVNGQWKMLMAKRTEEIGGKFCELCNSVEKLDFHESFEIKKNVFILKGMFWLCRKCHSKVHAFGNSYNYFPRQFMINNNKELLKASEQAFLFNISTDVSVDYSWLGNYGIDYKAIQNKWLIGGYNQKFVALRFLTSCMMFSPMDSIKKINVYECLLNKSIPREADKGVVMMAECIKNNFMDFFIDNILIITSFTHRRKEIVQKILAYLNLKNKEDMPFTYDYYFEEDNEEQPVRTSRFELPEQMRLIAEFKKQKKDELNGLLTNKTITPQQYIKKLKHLNETYRESYAKINNLNPV